MIAASTVRALDYGFLSVFLGVYLNVLDFSVFQAGLVFSGIMAGGALSNGIASWKGDTIGRRRMLVVMSSLMVLGGVLFPFVSSVGLLVIIGLFAMTSATGGDRTAFSSLDLAIMAQTSRASQRTTVFALYDFIGFTAKAVGVLLITVPSALQSWLGMDVLSSFKAMFGLYAAIALVGIPLYARLSSEVESKRPGDGLLHGSRASATRSRMLRLAALFSVDALGGGFMVNSFISFWFASRFGVDISTIAGIFFAGQVLNAASLMLAAPVAHRIGLINTMVSTQILANLLMIGVPLSGDLWLSVAFFLGRELANDMDVPTRQSYIMAIVPSEARTAMASVTNLGRNVAQVVSPGTGGFIAQLTFLGAPFLIGSATKLLYNALIYFSFRNIRPPEEQPEVPSRLRGVGGFGGSTDGDGGT